MVHEVYHVIAGPARNIENDAKNNKRVNYKFMALLAKNCGLKDYAAIKDKFREVDADEIWLDADEAVKFGIVDAVGMPMAVPMDAWQIALAPPKVNVRDLPTETDDKKPRQKKSSKATKKVKTKKK